ncbi:MAG: SH3 domain-containing protein [Rhodobacteraceae bacterium]|nr:SH3 domain-containing protein [Paracoccaceae bacterium]
MSRFVIVSFAFMGWAFYELSGGADFQPPERPDPVAQVKPALRPAPTERVTAASLVRAEPVLAPRQKRSHVQAPKPSAEEQLAMQVQLEEEAAEARRQALSRGLAGGAAVFQTSTDTSGIAIASLEESAQGFASVTQLAPNVTLSSSTAETETVPEPQPDLREVTGTRVNMRDGPGTIYPVLTRLKLGNAVQVLSDSGTGWLRLRTVETGHVGWVAASLISKKSN